MNRNDGPFAEAGPGTLVMDTLWNTLGWTFWWFVLALFILLIIFVQFERIAKWVASPFAMKRERFDVPEMEEKRDAPSPAPEHDESCALFPAL